MSQEAQKPLPPSPVPGTEESFAYRLRADLQMWCRAGDVKPSARVLIRLVLLQPGFQLTLSIRLQEALSGIPLIGGVLRHILWYVTTIFFGSEISMGASIGAGIYLPHPWGIVIGEGVRIGKRCAVFQGVTLGRANFLEAKLPVLEDDVTIYSGAAVFGAIAIGEHATVGANSVVLADVPKWCSVCGVPAVIVMRSTPVES